MTAELEIRVVIAGGGQGTRFGAPLPKQFQLLGGRPVLIHGAERIASLPHVKEIVFVLPAMTLPPEVESGMDQFRRGHGSIPVQLIHGGSRRQDSVAKGLRAFSRPCDVAFIHDAARPFPPVDAMKSLASRAWDHGAAILALPATDTLKQSDEHGRVASTLDRRSIWRAQTPQALRGEFIDRLCLVLDEPTEFSDESAALESLGIPVSLVEGSEENFKITHRRDLLRAQAMLQALE